MTAIGLLGFITYVGRSKIEANTVEDQVAITQEGAKLAPFIASFVEAECSEQNARPPTKVVVLRGRVCIEARNFGTTKPSNFNWFSFQILLEELESELSRVSPFEFHRTISSLRFSVERMRFTVLDSAKKRGHGYSITYHPPWVFIAICFGIASCGVGLKCTRAYVEYKSSLNHQA